MTEYQSKPINNGSRGLHSDFSWILKDSKCQTGLDTQKQHDINTGRGLNDWPQLSRIHTWNNNQAEGVFTQILHKHVSKVTFTPSGITLAVRYLICWISLTLFPKLMVHQPIFTFVCWYFFMWLHKSLAAFETSNSLPWRLQHGRSTMIHSKFVAPITITDKKKKEKTKPNQEDF